MSLASEQECSTIGIKCLPPLDCVTNVLRKTAAENMYSYTFDKTKVFVSLNSVIRHLLFSYYVYARLDPYFRFAPRKTIPAQMSVVEKIF